MKITEAQKAQSHLIQEMGKAGKLGVYTLGNIERFKNFLNDLTTTPPKGCKFKVGDKVIHTNASGIEFELVILGFDARPRYPGATIFLADEAYWYAVEENCLRPVNMKDETNKVAPVSPGDIWEHRNGVKYKVLYLANVGGGEGYQPHVVYQGENLKVWTRPLSDWHRSMSLVPKGKG